jgi:hypothetical protein
MAGAKKIPGFGGYDGFRAGKKYPSANSNYGWQWKIILQIHII